MNENTSKISTLLSVLAVTGLGAILFLPAVTWVGLMLVRVV